MSLSSIGQSLGNPSYSTLPSNRSIIVADSRFRDDDVNESPYDFTAQLGGTGIYAKELYYQKLYWNQPLFSHNNTNNELRFQMNNDDTVTYVVYATPFLMYSTYDGNPEGTSLLTPQEFSYADNMEKGLNGDVRSLPNNLVLVNGTGIVQDSLGNPIQINFRYSPTKGFCIYPVQNPLSGLDYTIRLLPCSYISNAHYVHGFGVWDPTNPELGYVPVSMWSAVYWSDVSPNLLPIRYIVIQSAELNKDRRMISFHNGNFSNFVNELGLFSLNPIYTGIFHEDGVGDDATVISLRDDYKPQRFKIQILDEFGNAIRCDDPIRKLLASGLFPDVLGSFFSTTWRNRGSPLFTDFIVFGSLPTLQTNSAKRIQGILDTAALSQPNGMLVPFQVGLSNVAFPAYNNPANWVPVLLTSAPLTPLAGQIGAGLYYKTIRAPFNPPAIVGSFNYTQFTFYEQLNQAPALGIDMEWLSVTYAGTNSHVGFSVFMFDATPTDGLGNVQWSVLYEARLFYGLNYTPIPTSYSSATIVPMWKNIYYNPPATTKGRKVGFALSLYYQSSDLGITLQYNQMNPLLISPQIFEFISMSDTANIQTSYRVPNTDSNSYQFGDPQATALCEEVVHEIAAMLEFS